MKNKVAKWVYKNEDFALLSLMFCMFGISAFIVYILNFTKVGIVLYLFISLLMVWLVIIFPINVVNKISKYAERLENEGLMSDFEQEFMKQYEELSQESKEFLEH